MYNHEPKDYECPFCHLIQGKITDKYSVRPEDVVYQDDCVTIFVAGKWWKNNPGHVLIIPNVHIENLYDMTPKYLHRVIGMSKKCSIAFKKVYKCDGTSIRQHNEPGGDQSVWHYHMHVFPRYEGDEFYVNHENTRWVTSEEKRPYVEKLKAYFDKLK